MADPTKTPTRAGSEDNDGRVSAPAAAEAKLFIPEIDAGTFVPGRIKLELTSPLEARFRFFGFAFLAAAAALYFIMPFYKAAFAGALLACSAACFIFMSSNHDYFIADKKERKIFFHRWHYGKETVCEKFNAENILAITVLGFREGGSGAWRYALVAVDKSGCVTQLSDTKKDDGEEYDQTAQFVAGALGFNYAKCPPGCVLKAEGGDAKIRIVKA